MYMYMYLLSMVNLATALLSKKSNILQAMGSLIYFLL